MTDQEVSSGPAPILRSHSEELFNTMTHGIGLVFSIAGAIVLVACAVSQGDAWRVVGCSMFATALIAVYATSTLSHMRSTPQLRRWFRILDQGFIYLLIAATYTPFALAYLRTGWWWLLLCVMWGIALFGFFSKVFFAHRVEQISIWTYVVLGWLPCIAGIPLTNLIPAAALWWMLIGGLCYTLGTAFLMYDEKAPHFHAVWHLFVVAGSTCHFLSILWFVAPVS